MCNPSVTLAKKGMHKRSVGAASEHLRVSARSSTAAGSAPHSVKSLGEISVQHLILVLAGTKILSRTVIYAVGSWAARRTYVPAHYNYEEATTFFDNSAWTWGTDYFLAALMSFLAYRCVAAVPLEPIATYRERGAASHQLRIRSALLLILYAISTLAGAIAHQHYHSVDEMNSYSFQMLWTMCVGTVTMAGAAMLHIGSEINREYHSSIPDSHLYLRIPVVPVWFTVAYGMFVTSLVVFGQMSYTRPACDIFIAGTTQTVRKSLILKLISPFGCLVGLACNCYNNAFSILSTSRSHPSKLLLCSYYTATFYLIAVVLSHCWGKGKLPKFQACDNLQASHRWIFIFGLLFNIPLLPMYPLLVQYTDLSLGTVNTLLHSWLTVSWGTQAIGLRHFCSALSKGPGMQRA